MTMHAARAWKWDHVLLPGLCGTATGGQTPDLWQMLMRLCLAAAWRPRVPSLDPRPGGDCRLREGEGPEDYLDEHRKMPPSTRMEDRRLMYVAMTRARNLLAMSATTAGRAPLRNLSRCSPLGGADGDAFSRSSAWARPR